MELSGGATLPMLAFHVPASVLLVGREKRKYCGFWVIVPPLVALPSGWNQFMKKLPGTVRSTPSVFAQIVSPRAKDVWGVAQSAANTCTVSPATVGAVTPGIQFQRPKLVASLLSGTSDELWLGLAIEVRARRRDCTDGSAASAAITRKPKDATKYLLVRRPAGVFICVSPLGLKCGGFRIASGNRLKSLLRRRHPL